MTSLFFKKGRIELELIFDTDRLLIIEKGIRGGICHAINRCETANIKYMNNCDKNIEPSYLTYLDENNLYGWSMSQKVTCK